jgi:transcriptional regulator with XRE-family HTH domain
MSVFGERLRKLIRERKIGREELAEYLDVHWRTIYHYETDKREPNISQLIKIANFFDISLDYLVGRSDDPARH